MNLMKKKLIITWFCLGITTVFYCDPGPQLFMPLDNIPQSINAFLDTAADSQYVFIQNMQLGLEAPLQIYEREMQLLNQAQISLWSENQAHTFPVRRKEIPDSNTPEQAKLVWISPQPVLPGITYHLQVTLPGNEVYRAETTLPGDFEILLPNPEDTLNIDEPLTVTWTPSTGAAGYRVMFWSHILDSLLFKAGTGPIRDVWSPITYIINIEDPLTVQFDHHYRRSFYSEVPDPIYNETLLGTKITVEALDAAYWMSQEINLNTWRYTSSYRIEPVAYSNFNQGYGIFCGVTQKVLHLKIPGGQK